MDNIMLINGMREVSRKYGSTFNSEFGNLIRRFTRVEGGVAARDITTG